MSIQRVVFTGDINELGDTRTQAETEESYRAQSYIKARLMLIARDLGPENQHLYVRLYDAAKIFLTAAPVQSRNEAEHKMMMLAHQLGLLMGNFGVDPLWTKPTDAAAGIIAAFESSQ